MSAVILLSKADLKQGTEACSPPSQTAAGLPGYSHMFPVGRPPCYGRITAGLEEQTQAADSTMVICVY